MKDVCNLSSVEKYYLIGQLLGQIKSHDYSHKEGENYLLIVKEFLNSGLKVHEFLLNNTHHQDKEEINKRYRALKFFYEKVLNERFEEDKSLTREEKDSKKTPNKEEVKKLLNSIINSKHQLMVALMYYAGLRTEEVIDLRFEDLDFKNKKIKIKESNEIKERIVFFHDKLINHINHLYLKKEGLMFVRDKNRRYSIKEVEKVVNKACKRAGIKKKICSNTFRYCFSNHLLNAGAKIKEIEQLIGQNKNQPLNQSKITDKNLIKLANLLD